MGKSCVRFKKLEDLPLDVIGQAVSRVPVKKFIEHYEAAIKGGGKRASTATKAKTAKTKTKPGASKASSAARRKATSKKTAKTTAKTASKRTTKRKT